jgi:hemoglobin
MSSTHGDSEEPGSKVPSHADKALPIGSGAWLPSPQAPGRSLGGTTIYDRLGGPEPFWKVARAFYARIEVHAALRPMFPADLEEPIRNQAEFLIQYFGGPQAYSDRKGHPRLRMRHAKFRIDVAARNAWVEAMKQALEDAQIPEPERAEMIRYFEHAATFLVNTDE